MKANNKIKIALPNDSLKTAIKENDESALIQVSKVRTNERPIMTTNTARINTESIIDKSFKSSLDLIRLFLIYSKNSFITKYKKFKRKKVYLLEMRILQHLSDKKINNGQNEKYKKSKKKP